MLPFESGAPDRREGLAATQRALLYPRVVRGGRSDAVVSDARQDPEPALVL